MPLLPLLTHLWYQYVFPIALPLVVPYNFKSLTLPGQEASNRGQARERMAADQTRKQAVALALALLLAAPLPMAAQTQKSAPSKAASPSSKAPVKKTKKSRVCKNCVPTFANSTADDIPEFDDPVVREAAVTALGRYNGSVVVADAATGRILTIVNQRMAFTTSFKPCSTVKPIVAVAALSEGVVRRDSMIKVGRRTYMNMTEAMAHSNNPYFEVLGRQMGFDTVSRYAKLLGFGETAGYEIFEEQPGVLPAAAPSYGGVGRMSSFGEGIQITPLHLTSLAAAFATGGTMYYLQYPRDDAQRSSFTPRVKRQLDLTLQMPELRDGMLAAVLYGTGRKSFDSEGEQILGKTGTCNDQGARLGWFFAFNDHGSKRLAVAVLLRGSSRVVNGSTAAEVAGHVYQRLREINYITPTFGRAEAVTSTSSQ